MDRTIEQIFRDDDTDENFMRWPPETPKDQELAGVNNLNDDYTPHDPPKREYHYLNFIDFDKYGVVMNNE